MKSLMKAKKLGRKFADGGEVDTEMEEGSGGYGALPEAEPAATRTASKTASRPVAPKGTPGGANRGQRAEAPAPQRIEITAKRYAKDDETKSVAERAKATLSRARAGGADADQRSVTSRMGGAERQGSSTTTDTRSLAERAKASRDRSRSSSTGTDSRSVGERVRAAFGFADGGLVKRQTAKAHGKAC